MSTTKHTSGPWEVNNGFVQAKSGAICQFFHPHSVLHFVPKEEEIANARLIAAAPQLLEACKDSKLLLEDCQKALLKYDDRHSTLTTAIVQTWTKIDAALAAAEVKK